jgi:hypothetical protein
VVAFSQVPGDCTITAVVGDELNIALEFTDQATPPSPIDLTGYTIEAKVFAPVYDNPENSLGTGGLIVGPIAATFSVSAVDLEEGLISLGLTETQTGSLSTASQYRFFLRWVDPDGVTLTVLSGDFVARIP